MNAFILVGSNEKQKEYLDSFCSENAIKTFYKHEFPEFKILDARNLIKLLSKKLHKDEKQIIIVSNPTPEAQHAILKTIEELPESVYVFFLCVTRDAFLPTIMSRCKILSLDTITIHSDTGIEEDLEQFFNNFKNPSHAFLFAEKYGQDKQEIEKIILGLRTLLLKNVENEKMAKAVFDVLQHMVSFLPLIKQNNIQPRFAVESALTSILPS